MNTPIEYGVKLSKNNEGDKTNSLTFKSLVKSLKYMICTPLNILYGGRTCE